MTTLVSLFLSNHCNWATTRWSLISPDGDASALAKILTIEPVEFPRVEIENAPGWSQNELSVSL
ncbi:hypothetical protein SPB21_06700 [Leptothoe sp. ISB3NOV94-8A]